MNFIVFRISKYKNTTLCEPKELSFEESEWRIQDSILNKKKKLVQETTPHQFLGFQNIKTELSMNTRNCASNEESEVSGEYKTEYISKTKTYQFRLVYKQ